MRLQDLLDHGWGHIRAEPPECDALAELDALLEGQLISVTCDAMRARTVLIVDLRGALRIRDSNTAVIVLDGTSAVRWTGPPLLRQVHVILSWVVRTTNAIMLEAGMLSGAVLEVLATSATYLEGDVPGMNDPQPDLTSATDTEVSAGFANPGSVFAVHGTSSYPARP